MTIENDDYYVCLCGIHVHRAAYIISIVGMVLHTFAVISYIVGNEGFNAALSIISLACYICVFYANKYEKPLFYMPHIILNTVTLIIGAIISIVVLVTAISVIMQGKKEGEIDGKQAAIGIGVFSVIYTLTVVIIYLIEIYFIRVVYRARQYMINVMQPSAMNMPPPHFAQSGPTASVNNIL